MRHPFMVAIASTAIVGSALFGGTARGADPIADALASATKIGHVIGAASECTFIPEARVKAATAKIKDLLSKYAPKYPDVPAGYNKGYADGQKAITSKQTNCAFAETDLGDLEHLTTPWLPEIQPAGATAAPSPKPAEVAQAAAPAAKPADVAPPAAPPKAVEAPAPAKPPVVAAASQPAPASSVAAPPVAAQPPVHGITDQEIRFGIVAPFTGLSKGYGAQLKLGTLTAFAAANSAGGINGRKLVLVTADDGYDPSRTLDAVKQLYEKDQVFGFIGNFGTEPAAVALPYALSHKALFFAPFTGAGLTRHEPPDRYVFNYRPSYAEETAQVVHYLVKVRHLHADQIAVFTQQDGFGEAGFEGVARAMRSVNANGDSGAILRLTYPRGTVDVGAAVTQLQQYQKQHANNAIKAIVMVATYRPAAKFIEKTRDAVPGLLYTNVSAVGSSALAEELMVLGSKFAKDVIVTQAVPPVESYAGVVLDYKAALEKYAPGETPDYLSLEAYLQAEILIEGLRRTGPQIDPDRLVAALEGIQDFDLGLGQKITFSRTEHQALHKVWGTQLDATGHYQPLDLE